MKLRSLVALIITTAIPVQTLAQPHVIAQLGNAPVIGRIDSTSQLQHDVAHYDATFRAAGDRIGLTPKEYAQFAQRIAARRVAYVTLPRHLDAMTWAGGGNVYALNDVIIPPDTKGWEVDLQEGHRVLALFVPARCGNLALLRRALPVVAQAAHPRRHTMVEAASTAPPGTPAAPAPPVAQAPAVGLPPTPPPAVSSGAKCCNDNGAGARTSRASVAAAAHSARRVLGWTRIEYAVGAHYRRTASRKWRRTTAGIRRRRRPGSRSDANPGRRLSAESIRAPLAEGWALRSARVPSLQ